MRPFVNHRLLRVCSLFWMQTLKRFATNSPNHFLKSSNEVSHQHHSLAYFSTVNERYLQENQVKELLIPIPYGHIAAKTWGKETSHPILALHGWLDNCGTFDKLFPLLLNKFYIIAVDAPGHGMSSHKPPGSFYSDTSMMLDLKNVTDYLGWQNFSIIGHSLGGAMALMFACLFPENIHKLVILDIVKPSSRETNLFPDVTSKAIKNHLENEKKMLKPAPVYSLEAAANRLQKGMFNEITLEGARILNRRGTRSSECGKGLVFSRDIRCRTMEELGRKNHEMIKQYMTGVKCDLLMIMANNTHPNYATATPEVVDTFLGIYRKHTRSFTLQHVDGNHFVHLNNPERIAPAINDFLLNK